MRIHKIGHSCFVAEESGVRVLFDPGEYASGYEEIRDLSAIVITHEHKDHVSIEALRVLLSNNPNILVATNEGVGAMLSAEGITYQVVGAGGMTNISGVSLRGFSAPHAQIYGPVPAENIGYLFAEKLYHPGDSLIVPPVAIDVLALPVAAPWMKLSEGIDFALSLKPSVCFPIHDGMLIPERSGSHHVFPGRVLPPAGVRFVPLKNGESFEV